jgi:acetoin utilization protein AcuB
MRVQEVMTDNVRTVTPAMPAEQARSLMKTDKIHHLVVVNGRRVVGVLSDRDTGETRDGRTVAEVMTRRVATIEQDATIRQAANVMRGRTIGCLPVLRNDRLVGIVTTADLLRVIGGAADRPGRQERHTLNYKTAHRGKKASTGTW